MKFIDFYWLFRKEVRHLMKVSYSPLNAPFSPANHQEKEINSNDLNSNTFQTIFSLG